MKAKSKILLGTVLLLVGGLVLPALILVPAFDAPAEKVVFEAPGQATLEVEAPGRFYLWHDYRTVHEGRQVVRDEHLPNGMSFEVTRANDGAKLAFQPRTNIHTEIGEAESRSIGYVDIERPGTFRIEVRGADDGERVMSFSRARFMLFAGAIGFSLLTMIVAGTAGVILIVIGFSQRAGERRDRN